MAKYYTKVCNNFKAKKVKNIYGKYYTIVCNNFKDEKVTKFMAKQHTIVCNDFKAKNSQNLWQILHHSMQ